MLDRCKMGVWISMILLALSQATAVGSVEVLGQPQAAERPTLHYADLVLATVGFDQVLLWEGLPHFFDKARKTEMAKPNHFTIDQDEFYDLPLVLDASDQKAVSDVIVATRSNFEPWSGFKFCGGFHGDYAVEWRRGGKTLAQALICFSCGEARFLVGQRKENVDLSKAGRAALFKLLWPHHSLRPRADSPNLTPPKLPAHTDPEDWEPLPPPSPQPPPMPEAGKPKL